MSTIIFHTSSSTQFASPPDAAQQLRRPKLKIACWCYFLAVVAFWILSRQIGDRNSVGALMLVLPKWLLLIPALVLVPIALKVKNWRVRFLVAAATAIVVVPLMGFRFALPNASSEQANLRVLTFNVHRAQVDADQLAQFMEDVNPDVVVIQDWSSANQETLFDGNGWHLQREGELLIASRFPIGRVTPFNFAPPTHDGVNSEWGAAACFELLTSAGPVNLIDVHLASPHSGLLTIMQDRGEALSENLERRWEESESIRDLAGRTPEPLILAGDFNTSYDSPIFREHWGDFVDAFDACGCGFGYTYLIGHTQLRIDHILGSPSCRPLRCWVGPEMGSPHRPVVADFQFR